MFNYLNKILLLILIFSIHSEVFPATIKGTVKSSDNGKVINGIIVKLKGYSRNALTDASGRYVIDNLPAGGYVVQIQAFNWKDYMSEKIDLKADETATLDITLEPKSILMDGLVVYGVTKKAEKITESPAAVTVKYPGEIDIASRKGQIAQSLEGTPGVDILRNGASDFIVNTRGFNSGLNRRVLVLQDGRDVAMPLLGAQEWNSFSLPLDEFSRVELVRGPSASLYGANAFNGVLNLTSYAPREQKGLKVSLLGGDYETFRGDVRYADVIGKFGYRVSFGHSQSLNFSKRRDSVKFLEYDGIALERRELTEDDRQTFAYYGTARLDYYIDDEKTVTAEAGYTRSGNETFVFGLGRTLVKDTERPWLRLAYNSDRINIHGHFMNRFCPEPMWLMVPNAPLKDNSKDIMVDFQHNFYIRNDLHFIWGVSEQIQYIRTYGTSIPDDVDANYTGIYSQLNYELSDLIKIVASGRVDLASIHSTQFSPRLAVVLSPFESHNFRVSTGRSFQRSNYSELYRLTPDAPAFTPLPGGGFGPPVNFQTIQQRIIDSIAVFNGGNAPDINLNLDAMRARAVGNEGLEVEKNIGVELGYKGVFGQSLFVTVDVYYNQLTDFITNFLPGVNPEIERWQPNLPEEYTQYSELVSNMVRSSISERDWQRLSILDGQPTFVVSNTNVGKVDQYGIDLGVNYYISNDLLLQANYSYYDFEIVEADILQPLYANTSPHKFNINLTYTRSKNFDVGLAFHYSAEYDWIAGTYLGKVPAYNYVNLTAGVFIMDNLNLGLNVFNLFDNDFYQVFGGTYLPRYTTVKLTYEI